MRKFIIFITLSLFILSGCNKKSVSENNSADNQNVPEKSITKYDFDLTNMSYNVLSGVLFDILIDPDKYSDKTLKVTGEFNTQIHEGKRYFSVIKWDATGCCPTGIDFIPPDNMKYPENFPESGSEITVSGQLRYINTGVDESLCFFADEIIS